MRPLDGLLVLDFSRVLSGPYCTMQLADLGARVIKIEQPGRGDETRAWGPPFLEGESSYFLSVNRNKESLALDLKHPGARPIVEALIDRADVIVENFRPGTMERLGFGYAAVADRRPSLVYCSISGFGQTGPRRAEPGYDAVMQAEGGLMSITGDRDGPPFRLGVAIADLATGLFAAQGILAALLARARTGRGQLVDLGMLDTVASLLTYQAGIVFATGTSPGRMGNQHPSIAPYDTFATADGDFVLAVGNDDQFRRMAAVLESPALASDARFATNSDRVHHYGELRSVLSGIFVRWTRDRVVRALTDAGVPCGAVRSVTEALADPQLAAREMIVPLDHPIAGHVRVLGNPMKLSETSPAIRTPPPSLGQHTAAILQNEVGLSDDQVASLRTAGAIA
ncbi:MAG TPA: CoA transferase [Vicinamibacterales bacterium]|jgi:crotonobetainyl-CoA:carnitine CoA-transferase CaiB-like acyl-CoA transferase|nr:CoA transferase [Vicinamibacterales bacterium]